MIRAVLFDVIGTLVQEVDPQMINMCFERAFVENTVKVDRASILKERGKDKKTLIKNILQSQNLSTALAERIYASFKRNILNSLSNFQENEGAAELLAYLKEKNIKTGIGTGLERDLFEPISHCLGWNNSRFDYVGIGNEIGRGRPYPDMIIDMMDKLDLIDTSEFLKVGDTVADIQEGKNAHVLTGVILSGTQPKDVLLKEKPDLVFTALSEIKNFL
jgi:HAD superfamily hydrolase (TIGR01549 family)